MKRRNATRWCVAMVALVMADLVLTVLGLLGGHAEGNPLLAAGIEKYGLSFLFLAKAVPILLLVIAIPLIKTAREASMLEYGCVGLCIVYIIPVMSWSYILLESL